MEKSRGGCKGTQLLHEYTSEFLKSVLCPHCSLCKSPSLRPGVDMRAWKATDPQDAVAKEVVLTSDRLQQGHQTLHFLLSTKTFLQLLITVMFTPFTKVEASEVSALQAKHSQLW